MYNKYSTCFQGYWTKSVKYFGTLRKSTSNCCMMDIQQVTPNLVGYSAKPGGGRVYLSICIVPESIPQYNFHTSVSEMWFSAAFLLADQIFPFMDHAENRSATSDKYIKRQTMGCQLMVMGKDISSETQAPFSEMDPIDRKRLGEEEDENLWKFENKSHYENKSHILTYENLWVEGKFFLLTINQPLQIPPITAYITVDQDMHVCWDNMRDCPWSIQVQHSTKPHRYIIGKGWAAQMWWMQFFSQYCIAG